MPGKWDWLKDELRASGLAGATPLVIRFISGRLRGADDLVKCALCPNMCRHACPVGIVDGRETTSPAGKTRAALLLRQGRLQPTLENVSPLYTCLSCNACSVWCPFGFSVADLVRPVKEKAAGGGSIFKEFREVFENLEKHGYVYGEPKREDSGLHGDLLYLRGCTLREKQPGVAEKAEHVLEELGYRPFTIDEACCGIPAYNLGNTRLFKRVAEKQAEKINSSGAGIIVASCPSCVYAYRVLYPKHGVKINAEVNHIAEFLEGRLKGFKGEGRVVIHNPCKLAFALGKPKALYNTLSSVEGLTVREPRRSGGETFCCGYGGSAVPRLNPQLARRIALERGVELTEEAETIVTACPTCKLALESNGFKVLDVMELLHSFTSG
jgi:Fe-S oxidoreductase